MEGAFEGGGALKILLAGAFAGTPWQGGATSAVFQYFEGLTELGHDVLLVEQVKEGALAPGGEAERYVRSLSLRNDRFALLEASGARTIGASFEALRRFAGEADMLLNLSGVLREQRLLEAIELRAYLDLDPCFTQLWHLQGHDVGLDLHTHFVTVGAAPGTNGSLTPSCGRDWIAMLPPVSLAHWPLALGSPTRDAFTSVGHWRSYGAIEHEGVHYGQRAHSLRRLIDLPRRSDVRFQLALGIHRDERTDIEALAASGWELVDPALVASTPARYREFVRSSKAEICVAKSGYVVSRSGWLSDRSVCYLASGRPVLAQDTGFAQRLPTGDGLLRFDTAEEAAAGAAEIEAHLQRHERAARALAEEHFDARKVLRSLLDRLGAVRPKASAAEGLR